MFFKFYLFSLIGLSLLVELPAQSKDCLKIFHDNSNVVAITPRLEIRVETDDTRDYQIYERSTGLLVGRKDLIAIRFEPWARGKGYGKEVMVPILTREFKLNRYRLITAFTVTDASHALFRRLGFVPIRKSDTDRVKLSYVAFRKLKRKHNLDSADGLKAFSSPSKKRSNKQNHGKKMMLLIRDEKVDEIHRFLSSLSDTKRKNLLDSVVLRENQIKIVDFCSRFDELIGDRSLQGFFASIGATMMMMGERSERTFSMLKRFPESLIRATYEEIISEYELDYWKRHIQEFEEMAITFGLELTPPEEQTE